MSNIQANQRDLIDCLDNVIQLKEAMQALTDLIGGCDNNNAPPMSYLCNLVAILSRRGDDIECQLKQVVENATPVS